MAYIEQNVFLFHTTIRENITLGAEFQKEELEEALRNSALYEDLKSFPQGLDTVSYTHLAVYKRQDGMCGGYNLKWAWSSGYVTGRSAAGKEQA